MIATSLDEAIDKASACRYLELYEPPSSAVWDLEAAITAVLITLGDPATDDRAWRSLGFMGRAMLVEVKPTLITHWPSGTGRVEGVHLALDTWLSSESMTPFSLDPVVAPRVPQALSDAMDVVRGGARLLERVGACAAMLDILDAVFQGYAVFPGSAGRRVLFDWWLQEVVPAAAALRAPRSRGVR